MIAALPLLFALAQPPAADDPAALWRDLARFPPRGIAELWAPVSWAHWEYLRDRKELNPDKPWWPDAVREMDRRADCWLYLKNAHTGPEHGYWLEKLRCRLGERDFLRGRMPAPMICLDDVWGEW